MINSKFMQEANDVMRKMYLEDDTENSIDNMKTSKELEDEEKKKRDNYLGDVKNIEKKDIEDKDEETESPEEEKKEKEEGEPEKDEVAKKEDLQIANDEATDDLKDEESQSEIKAVQDQDKDNNSKIEIEIIDDSKDDNEVNSTVIPAVKPVNDENETLDDAGETETPNEPETPAESETPTDQKEIEPLEVEEKDEDDIEEFFEFDFFDLESADVDEIEEKDNDTCEDFDLDLDSDVVEEFEGDDTDTLEVKDELEDETPATTKKVANKQIEVAKEDFNFDDLDSELSELSQEASELLGDTSLEEDLEITSNFIDDLIENDNTNTDIYEFDIFDNVDAKSKNFKRKDITTDVDVFESADIDDVTDKDEDLEEWILRF